jgi:hypothetical protein
VHRLCHLYWVRAVVVVNVIAAGLLSPRKSAPMGIEAYEDSDDWSDTLCISIALSVGVGKEQSL